MTQPAIAGSHDSCNGLCRCFAEAPHALNHFYHKEHSASDRPEPKKLLQTIILRVALAPSHQKRALAILRMQ